MNNNEAENISHHSYTLCNCYYSDEKTLDLRIHFTDIKQNKSFLNYFKNVIASLDALK